MDLLRNAIIFVTFPEYMNFIIFMSKIYTFTK